MEKDKVYYVHNATRSVHTKALRQQGLRPKLTQRLLGGELTVKRGRPKALRAEDVRLHLAVLQEGVRNGSLRILDGGGRPVDLVAEFGGGAPPTVPPVAPLPTFVEDSIKNDINPIRPGRVSDNVAHSLEPSEFAKGSLPELLRPTLEQSAETEESTLGEPPADEVAPQLELPQEAPPVEASAEAAVETSPKATPPATTPPPGGKKGKQRR